MHRMLALISVLALTGVFMHMMAKNTKPNADVDDIINIFKQTSLFLAVACLVAILVISRMR